MAGAATGAGTGAAVDLVAGGATTVQLSDDMLQALLAATLLRYLTLAHFSGAPQAHVTREMAQVWKSKVVAAVDRRKETLAGIWADVRKRDKEHQAIEGLAQALQDSADEVLHGLHPAARS